MNKKLLTIGLMGGTFNPIHYGHLVTAEEARFKFGLDRVIFIPSGHPPHKDDQEILDAETRFLMSVIATASNPRFEVSRIEIERAGPSYAIDTVSEIKSIFGVGCKIFFITGADAIYEILTWKDTDKLVQMCSFIAATRPGYCLKRFKKEEIIKMKPKPDIHFLEVPALAISSTDIRERVRRGEPINYLVPEGVESYIEKNGYYKSG